MMRFLTIVLLSGMATAISGCAKKTCETIADECDMPRDLEDACVDDYKSGGDCRDAIKDLKKCVEDEGCNVYNDFECDREFEDVYDECDEIADWVDYYAYDYYDY